MRNEYVKLVESLLSEIGAHNSASWMKRDKSPHVTTPSPAGLTWDKVEEYVPVYTKEIATKNGFIPFKADYPLSITEKSMLIKVYHPRLKKEDGSPLPHERWIPLYSDQPPFYLVAVNENFKQNRIIYIEKRFANKVDSHTRNKLVDYSLAS